MWALCDGDVLLFVNPFVRLSSHTGLTGPARAVSSRSAAGPVSDPIRVMMAAGAYRVDALTCLYVSWFDSW